MAKELKITPLGGLGEIGKNMTLVEYGRNMLIVDCGVKFPDSDLFGIDLVLPDFDYVLRNKGNLRGILLTHGHMDHIMALPYLLREVQVPVYGTRLTLALVKHQLKEKNMLEQADLRSILPGERLHLGPFAVSPFAVAHSIPDAVGFVIDTPVGKIVHTGDYKLDETHTGGRKTDIAGLKALTRDGVLVMLADSTNADRPGCTPTEQLVADTLDRLFEQARGRRIILATFSSLLARLQEVMTLAHKHGRKVAITGRSMAENVAIAQELGYLKVPKGLLVDIDQRVPRDKLLILSTGSQGEFRSALNRMATGEHAHIQVAEDDTIIISGGTIPGNEEVVNRMLNALFERGAEVIYGPLAEVHVSGHGSRDEMRMMIEAVQPKYLLPVHGEARHRHLHRQLAIEAGMPAENVFLLQNGLPWVSDGATARTGEALELNDVYVDGRLVGEIGEIVLRDRQRLSQDGFIITLIPVDGRQRLVGEPQIISRGFVQMGDADSLLKASREAVKRNYRRGENKLRKSLEDLFYAETHSRPVVIPQYIQVGGS